MTYEEFEKKVQELGKIYNRCWTVGGDSNVLVYNEIGRVLASISRETPLSFAVHYQAYERLATVMKEDLLDLIIELAKTPIEEREDRKKYYLRHKFLYKCADTRYINIDIHGNMILADKDEGLSMKTKFTQKEIDEIKEKYNTDLKDFEIIEVKE